MNFRPQMIRGAPVRSERLGQVDYRLAREAVVRNFRNGRLSRLDVCDAHPELVRAARGIGDSTSEICPICEDGNVVLVSYAFGAGLAPGGHTVSSRKDVLRLARRVPELQCYVVEVCPGCSWNHLARSFRVSGRRRTKVAQ